MWMCGNCVWYLEKLKKNLKKQDCFKYSSNIHISRKKIVTSHIQGWTAVLSCMADQLTSYWQFDKDTVETFKNDDLRDVACAVSDPIAHDCPLTFVSKGFEELTGYPREFSLGLNFLTHIFEHNLSTLLFQFPHPHFNSVSFRFNQKPEAATAVSSNPMILGAMTCST